MPESDERMERLEREMRRLRGWILVLGIALASTFAVGATQGAPDELTLRRLAIVDHQGRERIVAMTDQGGDASLVHYDDDEKMRISVSTNSISASLRHYDADEKIRFVLVTGPAGVAGINFRDSKNKSVWAKSSH